MSDNKKITRPYVSLDGRYGRFEERFETWYLAQESRSTRMKEMLSVAFGIFEADPMLYSMLSGCSRDGPLSQEMIHKLVTACTGMQIPVAAPVEKAVKLPETVYTQQTESPARHPMLDSMDES